jgi:hypothetical protein
VAVSFTNLFTDPSKRKDMIDVSSSEPGKVVGGVLKEAFDVLDSREVRLAKEKARIEVEKEQQLEVIRLAKKAEEAEKAKREAAFKRFYQKPEHCYEPENHKIRVECANEYIRARRKFEDNYTDSL